MWRERPSSIGAYLQSPAASDRPARRIGCGCLPLVILLFVGSFFVRAVESVTDTEIDGGLVAVAVIVGILVLAIVGSRRRTRRAEERDAISDGAPTSTRTAEQPLPSAPPPTTTPAPAPPPSVGPRPLPGPRPSSPRPRASDAPLEPEAESLRQRLADAVADIAAEVDSSATGDPVRRPTSEEMIARAKQRIRDRGDQGD